MGFQKIVHVVHCYISTFPYDVFLNIDVHVLWERDLHSNYHRHAVISHNTLHREALYKSYYKSALFMSCPIKHEVQLNALSRQRDHNPTAIIILVITSSGLLFISHQFTAFVLQK